MEKKGRPEKLIPVGSCGERSAKWVDGGQKVREGGIPGGKVAGLALPATVGMRDFHLAGHPASADAVAASASADLYAQNTCISGAMDPGDYWDHVAVRGSCTASVRVRGSLTDMDSRSRCTRS